MMKKIVTSVILFLFIFAGCAVRPDYGEEELVKTCYSPNGGIELKIYQGPPADSVMVDFYTVGEIEFQEKGVLGMNTEKKLIYYKYHEEYEDAYWLDDKYVIINGCKIDITNKKTWINDKN